MLPKSKTGQPQCLTIDKTRSNTFLPFAVERYLFVNWLTDAGFPIASLVAIQAFWAEVLCLKAAARSTFDGSDFRAPGFSRFNFAAAASCRRRSSHNAAFQFSLHRAGFPQIVGAPGHAFLFRLLSHFFTEFFTTTHQPLLRFLAVSSFFVSSSVERNSR